MLRQFLFVSLLLGFTVATAHAQSVEATVGHAAFLDEDPIEHSIFGGSVRFALTPRLSVGPEIVYMIGPGHDRDMFVTGNLWFDLLGADGGSPRRVTPYLIAGGGLMRHRDEFFADFTANEGAVTGGIGVRIAVTDRWYVAPEARLGWEPHSRLAVTVGYRFRQ
ncbi:MAG TPA: hypothetical protein VG106_01305 [Vicinamibacterales bacterium]|nr:hypothetical protein [Vicinamibacterales bacterium]